MPALPDDIAAATREAVIVSWSDGAIQLRYPSAADGSKAPAEGFFDSAAEAQAAIAARGALLGIERRRFSVRVQALLWLDPSLGLPCAMLVDDEQAVSSVFLVSRVEVDLDAETTTLELFG